MKNLMTYKQFEKMQHSAQHVFISSILKDSDGKLFEGTSKNRDMFDLDETPFTEFSRKDEKGIVKHFSESFTQEELAQLIDTK